MRPLPSIKSAREFRRVRKQGCRARSDGVTVFVLARGDREGPSRLGLAVRVPRGRAVTRNRARRRLREAFARTAPRGFDVVVGADEAAASMEFAQLQGHVAAALRSAGAAP